MVNRELIRSKVIQLVYAYYQNGDKSIDTVEKELSFSLSKAYELYHVLLFLIIDLFKLGQKRYDIQCNRNKRLGVDREPSSRFVTNRFARQLMENKQLWSYAEKNGQSLIFDDNFERRLYQEILDSPIYSKYILSPEDSYKTDKNFWKKIYKTYICNNEELDNILEEHSLYWNDDKMVIDSFVLKTINRFDESNGPDQALLPEFDGDGDQKFAHTLLEMTLVNKEKYRALIQEHGVDWEIDRMPLMDQVIAQVALAEILNFPTIPLNVSFNEYLALTKVYSTPKSSSYLNGLLDHIVKTLQSANKLIKK